MASGDAVLADMIRRLRKAGRMVEEAAPACAAALQGALQATAAAGTTPDGTAWAPTKEGGRAMANAAAAITVTPVGTTLLARLTGPEVFHHRGVRNVKRQVIPTSSLPERAADAIRGALVAWWNREVAR